MRRLSLSDARAQLPALADALENGGEPIVITRRGRPVLKLVPWEAGDGEHEAHPLRGLPLTVAEDFDAPFDAGWEALAP